MREIERFLSTVCREPLLPAPTPLHGLRMSPGGRSFDLWIKRDDMTGIGPGGNKVRSLEYILGEAKAMGATKILTAGPEQSNLCVLTAAACAKAGLDCELIINAEEPERKEGNLLLEELLGTKIHFLGPCGSEMRNDRMEEIAAEYQAAGEQVYVVRNGATTGRGALGYTAAIVEMQQQCREKGIEQMTIFAPGGNGGVAAGLIYGNVLMGMPFRIVIISVEDDWETLTEHIQKTISQTEEITGLSMGVPVENAAQITDEYRGAGWGEDTEESRKAVLTFARQEGIFIENVYNSKVLVGMMDWLEKGKVSGSACYLHTGGFGSLFAQYEKEREKKWNTDI